MNSVPPVAGVGPDLPVGWFRICLQCRAACHQRDSEQRIHNQRSQAHPRRGLQEACPVGCERGPEICREGGGSSRRVHQLQAQQSCPAEEVRTVRTSRKRSKAGDSPDKRSTLAT
ncbi:hypothetical protein HPG69_014496 [Diceros bicornis minor]|uniref:Uncharacterized protein n=1 Tax=Diceros bicornis minor TaxID=77932 RepID=A0A7J7F4W8_DICBM|nr:hypothetical protein HPG69_014496 [Diceros bicornis minor]